MPEAELDTQGKLLLKPGTLWQSVLNRTNHALKCGALHSIPTEYEEVEDGGVCFLVRILSNLNRKYQDKQKQDQESTAARAEFNPFLPYEEDLFVVDISTTHVCILNKFNVVDYHLLIVTRAFEEQESLLTLQDFEAMWTCLTEFNSLAFYNSGKSAGASQRHKHLQLVPLPLAPQESQIPIAPLVADANQNTVGIVPGFGFKNAIARLQPHSTPQVLLELYYTLLRQVDLLDENTLSGAYNLLATTEWMLIIPRKQESFNSISVNSLGFAGALLVRNQQQMQIVKDLGPMTVLSKVTLPTEEIKR